MTVSSEFVRRAKVAQGFRTTESVSRETLTLGPPPEAEFVGDAAEYLT
jgi:hypothetical protein